MNTIALRNQPVAALTFTMLFWAVAAIGVTAAHQILDPMSPAIAEIAKIAVLLAAASALTLFGVRTIEGALFAGVVWGVLAIAVEIIATVNSGHGWFALLGSPLHPALRDVLLATWIFAPALFARRRPSC